MKNIETQEVDNLQTITLQEYEPQLWTCSNCFCGVCVWKCPAFVELETESVTARGLAQIGLAVLRGEVRLSDLSDEILYSCTGCRWCESDCSLNTPAIIARTGNRKTRVSGATIAEILRSMKVEEGGVVPKAVKDALEKIMKYGNPYGVSKAAKNKWVESLGRDCGRGDVLLYLGSTVPYENRATKMAGSLIRLLEEANVEFSMVGGEEYDSGAFARYMGDEGLLEYLIKHNSKIFDERGIKRIVCLSPHDYDTFLNYYQLDGVDLKHYSEVLLELVKDGRFSFKKEINKRVTYQDPCYWGRKFGNYEGPRQLLGRIPGVELVEMEPNRVRSYCCGGGGSGLWYDLPKVNMNCTRVDQAREQNVQYLAVACPICLQMLDDGAKSRNYNILVKDIAEIITEAL